jgi:excisionase family DNA binding protein
MPERLLTVTEAAQRMGVTPRCVVKYLNSGRIRGRKTGKSWQVDAQSLSPPAERTGTLPGTDASGAGVRNVPNAPRNVPERSEQGKPGRLPLPPRPLKGARKTRDAKFARRERPYSVTDLGAWKQVYPVVLESLKKLAPQAQADPHDVLREKARDVAVEALCNLAQGYHAYHLRDKVAHYQASRQRLCTASALMTLVAGLGGKQNPRDLVTLAKALEGEPLGAITGLIRVLENRRSKPNRNREQGPEGSA